VENPKFQEITLKEQAN